MLAKFVLIPFFTHHTYRQMIRRVTTPWGRHASSSAPKAAFTAAAAAGKGRDSTKSEAREHKKETLALVGCGKMGLAMGRNLLKAGYPLFVHDKHNAEAMAKLVAEVRRYMCEGKRTKRRGFTKQLALFIRGDDSFTST
jgi:lactate dehydrogenase-like 2-hydroxyacid dehydrogenase